MKFSIWFLLLVVTFGFSNQIGDEYKKVAQNFLIYQNSNRAISSFETLKLNNQSVGYVVKLKPKGYLIIPLAKRFAPIVAYSFESDFDRVPKGYKDFLINILKTPEGKIVRNSFIDKRWNFLENLKESHISKSFRSNNYLLKTTWDQNYPYNMRLPKLNGKNVLTGCVQTAIAQVMRYHKYPKRGRGIAVYNWNNQKLKAIFYKNYNWDNMALNFNGDEEEYQKDEVAYLMRDLAIANRARFSLTNTSTPVKGDSLIRYFGYSNQMKSKRTTSSNYQELINITKNEIDNYRPFILSFPTHAVVADGYREDGTGFYLHLNMGWGGVDNNFYNLRYNVTTSDNGSYDSGDLSLLYNIKPCSSLNGDCYQNLESGDKLYEASNLIQGTFDYQMDRDYYPLYLKGKTIFRGNRGYSSQAFFINLYDNEYNLIASLDSPFSIDLKAGLYYVNISLYDDRTTKYYKSDGYNNYSVNYQTSPLSSSEKAYINSSAKKPPIIETDLKDLLINSEKKIYINVLDENGEYPTLKVKTSSSDIQAYFQNNILTIKPNTSSGSSEITIVAKDSYGETSKSFKVLVSDEKIYFGKEFTISDKFNYQNDLKKHKVLLSGNCQIKGYNGYTNQAFYTAVMSRNGNYITNIGDYTINRNFNSNLYFITASLNNAQSNRYYDFSTMNHSYTISVSCPNSSVSIDDIANYLNINTTTNNNATINNTTTNNKRTEEVKAFVTRFYQTILNREPDSGGLTNWTNELLSKTKAGADIAKGFIFSPEFTLRNVDNSTYLITLYKAFFNREPDVGGFNDWIGKLDRGYSRESILNGFLYSQEFYNLCEKYNIRPN